MTEKKCWRCGDTTELVELPDGDLECLPCNAQTAFENHLEDYHNNNCRSTEEYTPISETNLLEQFNKWAG